MAGVITYFIVDDDHVKSGEGSSTNIETLRGIKHVLTCPNVWLASFGIFFVYAAYCGLTYFIPFLKDIYMLPVALVGAYGIINQYALKMVGGPVGGFLADKVAKSPRST
jgi:predicted MFS family arabinose efflux permease